MFANFFCSRSTVLHVLRGCQRNYNCSATHSVVVRMACTGSNLNVHSEGTDLLFLTRESSKTRRHCTHTYLLHCLCHTHIYTRTLLYTHWSEHAWVAEHLLRAQMGHRTGNPGHQCQASLLQSKNRNLQVFQLSEV